MTLTKKQIQNMLKSSTTIPPSAVGGPAPHMMGNAHSHDHGHVHGPNCNHGHDHDDGHVHGPDCNHDHDDQHKKTHDHDHKDGSGCC